MELRFQIIKIIFYIFGSFWRANVKNNFLKIKNIYYLDAVSKKNYKNQSLIPTQTHN
jgi:hypothetical protein